MSGQQKGPLADVAIQGLFKQNKIGTDTLIWCNGMQKWTPLKHVQELQFVLLGDSPEMYALPQPVPRPAQPQAAAVPAQSVSAEEPENETVEDPASVAEAEVADDGGAGIKKLGAGLGKLGMSLVSKTVDKAKQIDQDLHTERTADDIHLDDAKEEILPHEVKGFNLGACLLSGIWCLTHGLWFVTVGMAVVARFVPYGWIASLGASILIGFKANEITLKAKYYRNLKHFKQVQRMWAIAGVIVTALLVLVYMTVLK